MKPATSRIEISSLTQLPKLLFKSSPKPIRLALGCGLGLALLTTTAFAEVVGYFKFDNFPNQLAEFSDDSGKGLRGLLGFPFTPPASVAGPSGQASDRAVSLDGSAALAVDDSAAELLNILTPPLTVECWVRSSTATQIGVHRSFIGYGIPGGPPVEGLVRGGYSFGLGPSGDLRFTMFAVVDVFSGVPFPFDGEWHHVAAVYSAPDDGVHFYLDGVEVAFVAEVQNLTPPGTRHLDIGAFGTGLGRWIGDIDRARISKAALTPEQLDSVAATVKPVQNDTAVFLNFDETTLPYQAQGQAPAGVAISTADWVINNPPWRSTGGPNASAAGPLKMTDTPSAAAGDLALQFGQPPDNRADVAAVWDPNGVLNMNGDWTLEAWVKINPAFDGVRDVILYYGHPGAGYSLSVNYAAGNMLQVTTLGIADLTSDTAVVQLDAWQHLAVVHKNGESITYFVNGAQAGTRAETRGNNLATTSKVLYIGAEWDGALPFTGLIDRVRISNTALTAAELDSDPLNPATSPLRLAIALSQSNIILSWPEAGSAAAILEFSDVVPNANWTLEPTTPVVAAGQKTVTVPITGSARFYRLKQP